MDRFAVSHFSDNALLHDLKTRVAQDCTSLAVLLTRLAEVDERKLFLREAYSCMRDYCIRELHFSEGAARKRINAARAARRFPAVLMAVADGRLHLSGVVTLAGHLTSGNVDELVAAATHKTREEIELLLAQRFPKPDLVERLSPPVPVLPTALVPWDPRSPGNAEGDTSLAAPTAEWPVGPRSPGNADRAPSSPAPAAPWSFDPRSPGNVETPAPRPRVTPLAPERFGLQCTLDQETYDLLQQARALMSHQNPKGEIVPVLRSALKLLVGELERRKFAATAHPRPAPGRPSANPRHIPASVKRAVRERDGAQCAYISEAGKRCAARKFLEIDHADPVARGGVPTVENLRLLCRAHNGYAAERAFGSEFMSEKRAGAQARAAAQKQEKARRPDYLAAPAGRATC